MGFGPIRARAQGPVYIINVHLKGQVKTINYKKEIIIKNNCRDPFISPQTYFEKATASVTIDPTQVRAL